MAIEALFDQIGTSTEATTTDVFVSDISGDEARALVVVDVLASSTETPDQRLVDLTFVLDLVFAARLLLARELDIGCSRGPTSARRRR